MIELLDDMPQGTIGFRVAGQVKRDDYIDVLVPSCTRRSPTAAGCAPCT